MITHLAQGVVFIGVGLLGLGVLGFFRQRRRIARWERVEGLVIGQIPVRDENTTVTARTAARSAARTAKYRHRPQVRFTTADGSPRELVSPISARPPHYEIGARVPVLYDPHNPADARIADTLELWFAPAMLVFWGLFAIGMGVVGWWLSGA